MPDTTEYTSNKINYKGFINWLQREGFSLELALKAAEALETVEHYVKNKSRYPKALHTITEFQEIVQLGEKLKTQSRFQVMNITQKHIYHQSLMQYADYIKSISPAGITRLTEPQPKANNEVTEIFSGEKYKSFVAALQKRKIEKLEQLAKLNLIVFINENNLFQGDQRYKLLRDISEKIEAAMLKRSQSIAVPDTVETRTIETEATAAPVHRSESQPKVAKEVTSLFTEAKYKSFVAVLQKQKIEKLEQLAKLDLYALINENNTYLGVNRYKLIIDISEKIEAAMLKRSKSTAAPNTVETGAIGTEAAAALVPELARDTASQDVGCFEERDLKAESAEEINLPSGPQSGGVNEVAALFTGAKYQSFLTALQKDNIDKLEQIENLNLRIFLDRYNISHGLQRDMLRKDIRDAIADAKLKSSDGTAVTNTVEIRKAEMEVTAAPGKVPVEEIDQPSEPQSKVSNEVTALFTGAKYQTFLAALQKHSIYTIDQIDKLNLLIFFNENNIYPGLQRYTIRKDVREKIDAAILKRSEGRVIPTILDAPMVGSGANVEQDPKTDTVSQIISKEQKIEIVELVNKMEKFFTEKSRFLSAELAYKLSEDEVMTANAHPELFVKCSGLRVVLIKWIVQELDRLFSKKKISSLTIENIYYHLYSYLNTTGLTTKKLEKLFEEEKVLNYKNFVVFRDKYLTIYNFEMGIFINEEKNPDKKGHLSQIYSATTNEQQKVNEKDKKNEPHEEGFNTATAAILIANQVEEYLRERGLSASSPEIIRQDLNLSKSWGVGRLVCELPWCVEIENGKYIHRCSITDLDYAADIILRALKRLFAQNGGYTSSKRLFDIVRIDLDMFMFDNDFDSEEKIYAIARHLFEREQYNGQKFVFFGNVHIWEVEPNYPKNLMGLLIQFARNNGGIVTKQMCEHYLSHMGLSANNVHVTMRIGQDNYFWLLDSDKYILSEALGIDAQWSELLKNRLDILLASQEYVALWDIASCWYDMLPMLPKGEQWTPLLLQEAVRNCKVGYRTIPAGFGQSVDTVHAAITKETSDYRTFADIVWDYINCTLGTPIQIEAEQLRKQILNAGMLKGNERLYTMHKAIEDPRFIWLDDNKIVNVTKG